VEFSIPLNKFEKEKRVIELHIEEGKTIRDIAKEIHMSFRDISKIIKRHDKKLRLETKKESIAQTKKLSKNSQAYHLFLNGKTPVDVAIDLNLDFDKVRKYWTEFLRLQNMKDLYNIYIENEYHLDYIFRIYYFLLRNKISIKDCENILKNVDDVIKLNQYLSNIKLQINRLEQRKSNLISPRNNQYYSLKPLPKPISWNYQYTNNLL
jgi:transposase